VARVIDGKAIAEKVRLEVSAGAAAFRAKYGRPPGLHVVLAGDDAASAVYVRNKEKAASEVGFSGVVHRLPSSVTQVELAELVSRLNADDSVDAILVQLPLPKGLHEEPILKLISPDKDVDGFHASNVGALWSTKSDVLGSVLVPCTPRGCIRLLQEAGVQIPGKRALVIGRSNIVGKPIAALLLGLDATVTIAHSRTVDLAARCREAEIIIAAVGKPRFVTGDWVSPGAVVIDVGVNRDEHGKLCGDVDFDSVEPKASVITKVPGGVGPMTIAMLMDQTLVAANNRVLAANNR
jgi:methylenetetrahydrofolate dehydrogenase (NADP+) / methenyltetrahydrofolate cyclohydrolase